MSHSSVAPEYKQAKSDDIKDMEELATALTSWQDEERRNPAGAARCPIPTWRGSPGAHYGSQACCCPHWNSKRPR